MKLPLTVVGSLLLILSVSTLQSGLVAVLQGLHEHWGILQPLALFLVPGVGLTIGTLCIFTGQRA